MNRNLNVKWFKETATISAPSQEITNCRIKLLYDECLWLAEKRNETEVIESGKFKTLADAYVWAENILLVKTD